MPQFKKALLRAFIYFVSILVSLLASIKGANAGGEGVKRISEVGVPRAAVGQIFLSLGLASVVEFPRPISEVRVGAPGVVKVVISEVNPRELTLFLQSMTIGPTNLIVRSERHLFVFDLLPSSKQHQDFLKVSQKSGSMGNARTISRASPEKRKTSPSSSPTKKVLEVLKFGGDE